MSLPPNDAESGVDNHYVTKNAEVSSEPAERKAPDARTPVFEPRPVIGPPPRSAAGISSILATVKHGWEEMGVLRGTRALLRVNQKDGFDCQSCAWPNPEERHVAEFCENGAKAVAEEATTQRVTAGFFREHAVSELATQTDHWLGKQGRLTEPMILNHGSDHYEPISWDAAFRTIAAELRALDTPDRALFYTSGRTSNEAAFLYQLFVRQYGTNNLPDCSNMCHESSGTALTETIGVGKGTVTLEDFQKAGAIFIIGQNPGTNHPRMMSALQAAARRGCRIVSVNPLPETGLLRFSNPQEVFGILGASTPLSELFLQVRINGDVALLKGIMKEMLDEESRRPGKVLDHAFIVSRTSGFAEFETALRAEAWDTITEESGLSREQIRRAAQIAIEADGIIVCWAMGLTQHKNAVSTIQEIVNFLLLRGNLGRPGAGACPVRGHSNVQGDRTMGIWERPRDGFLDDLAKEFQFDPPRHHGFDTVESIKAMHDGRASVFFALGGNFLSATPDTDFTAAALRRCSLTVHVSTKLNRAHLITGRRAVILPCLGRSERDVQSSGEQFVTVEDSMGIVSASRGEFPPASDALLSEPAIVARLAAAVLGDSTTVNWLGLAEDYDRIRDHIEAVIPGFEKYNERIRVGPFVLPNSARAGEFKTSDELAHFTVHPIPRHRLDEGEYIMMTVRSHDQFNTTIYGLDDRYRGVRGGRRVIFMNRDDASDAGFDEGQLVDLTSTFDGSMRTAQRFAVVPYDIPRGCTATYFPETNVLVPIGSVAEKSNTPTSKFVVIRITPSDEPVSS